eukprot:5623700-Amphidinium_carterae.1
MIAAERLARGSRVYVRFGDAHTGEWHHRLITKVLPDRRFFVLTADEDHYEECYDDWSECRMAGERGGLPYTVQHSGLHVQRADRAYSAAQLREIFAEADTMMVEAPPIREPDLPVRVPEDSVWVFIESRGGHSRGDETVLTGTDVVQGSVAIRTTGAEPLVLRRVTRKDLRQFKASEAQGDVRLMNVELTAATQGEGEGRERLSWRLVWVA